MTQTTADEPGCALRWTPGKGGLLAVIEPAWVPATPPPDDPHAVPIPPAHLHVTLLRSASMAPLVDVFGPHWTEIEPSLPRPPRPRFSSGLQCATRAPHPTKDPPDETRSRSTWFLVVDDQAAWHEALRRIVTKLDEASRRRAQLTFRHPEPDRLFHVSLFNDRDGDPARSIGDIGPADCRRL